MKTTVIEAGHFYSSMGMTEEAGKGWDLIKHIQETNDKSLLFIDNVHAKSEFEKGKGIIPINIDFSSLLNELSDDAKDLITEINKNSKATVDQETKVIKPDFIFLEGDMKEYTEKVLEILFELSKKKGKPRRKTNGEIFCSGGKIIQNGGEQPTCAGYDLGLTYIKDKVLGFEKAINILPEAYKNNQNLVNKVYKKVNPNFKLEQYLY